MPFMRHAATYPVDQLETAIRRVALPDVARVEVLADHVGLDVEILEEALNCGEMPGRRVGGNWLVSRKALLEWLATTRTRRDRILAAIGDYMTRKARRTL